MPYTLPADADERPVVIDGAGTLGRRIAAVYAAGGSDVRIFDLSTEQREAVRDYVEEHVAETQRALGLHPALLCSPRPVEVAPSTNEFLGHAIVDAVAIIDDPRKKPPIFHLLVGGL
jgi:3-hydroxybutyryl-CoA dehydrogenase